MAIHDWDWQIQWIIKKGKDGGAFKGDPFYYWLEYHKDKAAEHGAYIDGRDKAFEEVEVGDSILVGVDEEGTMRQIRHAGNVLWQYQEY